MLLIEILKAFFLKAIDNSFSTFKTIYLQKEEYLIGSIFNSVGTFFYLLGVVQIAKSNGLASILSMCVATFIGTYIPGLIIKKSERDKLYIYEITASSFNEGKDFADTVRECNIAVKTNISYDSEKSKVLTCKTYCSTKYESKIVNKLIPQHFHYHIYTPLE